MATNISSKVEPPAPTLLPYQARWIQDQSPLKVYEKSRRIGITWTEACASVLDAARKNGNDWWYIGYNKEMALEFIEAAAAWARKFNAAAQAVEQVMLDDEDKDILAYRIRFAAGHKIVALSSRPANLRGKQGIAVIDEAAFHTDLKGLLTAALAMTMWAGKVHVISTHNGADSAFAELLSDIRAGRRNYSLHRTTLDDALDQGLYNAICQATNQEWSPEAQQTWRDSLISEYGDRADEELFCIPTAEAFAYLSTDLIESCMKPDIPILRWHTRGALERGNAALYMDAEDWIRNNIVPLAHRIDPKLMSCFGVDFGRIGDLTVIWPMQITSNLARRTPFIIELREVAFKQQEQILFALADKLPRLIGGAMDAGGNGQYLAEQAQLRYGYAISSEKHYVEAINLSVEWYRDNMPRYKAAFQDKQIELPRNDDILADHRMLRYEKGVARVPDVRIKDAVGLQRHGDSAIAGCLAIYASRSEHMEYAYQTPLTVRTSPEGPYYPEDYSGGRGRSWGVESRQRWGRSKGSW